MNRIRQLLVGLLSLSLATQASALAIRDTGLLQTSDQSMWSEGDEPVLEDEAFLGTRWGTYAGEAPETLPINLITGNANEPVPGTGGTIPNPVRIAWDVAMAGCQATGLSASTCRNGTPAVKACAPSWLGGGCTTIIPAVPGLGSAPPAEIDNPIGALYVDTRTGVAATLTSSGEAGIIPWVDASGGGIGVDVPFDAVISMPDGVQSGQIFTLQTSATIDGTEITAEAPSFKAGVDGLINLDNDLSGTACVILAGCTSDTVSLDMKAGRFGILAIDTTEDNFLRVGGDGKGVNSLGVPGIAFDKQYNIYAPTPENPDGVDDETTPKQLPSPKLGDVTVSNPQDFTGGTLSDTGDTLSFETYQQLLGLNVSLTGLAELSLGSPGFLANKISLIPLLLSIEYALLDVGVGPRFGVQQLFDFTPHLAVELNFDQPVTRVDGGGLPLETGNTIRLAMGSDALLRFDGEVGNLLSRTYYLDNPQFSNLTKATIDPGIKIELGCLEISLVFPKTCVFNEDYQTEGLIGIPVWDDQWTLGGFNTVQFFTPLQDGEIPPIGGGGGGGGDTTVPEPTSLLLFALALLLTGGAWHWRKRRED